MLQPIFDFLDKIATDFNWRRVVILFFTIMFLVVCFYFYEKISSTFELSKYERSVNILVELKKLDPKSSIEKRVIDNIIIGLDEITKNNFLGWDFAFLGSERLKLALFSSAPWILFTLAYFPGFVRGSERSKHAFIGAFIFTLIVGGIGYSLPEGLPNWFRYIGYGVVFNIIIAIGLIKYGSLKNN